MPSIRGLALIFTAMTILSMAGSLAAQRKSNVNRPDANATRSAAPAFVGKVVAYTPGKSISVETTNRQGVQKREFGIVADKTVIDLPPRMKEIVVGSVLAVWADKDMPEVAARIGPANNRSAATAANRRPNAARPETSKRPAVIYPPRQRTSGQFPAEIALRIDQRIDARLADEKLTAAPVSDDAEFLRRVFLDITGSIPPAERVTAFLDSRDPDKRAALIDELLASPHYGIHFGELWSDRIVPRDLPLYPQPLIDWLADGLNQNRGWNEIVVDLVTAGGDFDPIGLRRAGTVDHPPALFLLANSENNEPRPDRLAGASAALFLGVQVQCAECHDHPFASWKQTDFWGLAAFFGQLRAERGGQPPVSRWMESPPAHNKPVDIIIPATALKSVGTPVAARLLDGRDFPQSEDRPLRHVLARWLTAADNPFFARAAANRLWAHFFGRGLVNPVDDLHEGNSASHPELLQLLADEFVKSDYDLKHLVRCLCLSRTYQRTSQTSGANESDGEKYARQAVKPLKPGVLYDTLTMATGFRELRLGLPVTKSKLGVTMNLPPREAFIEFFHAQKEETDGSDYSYGIPQALKLLNAEQFHRVAPAVQQLTRSGLSRERAIEQLYLTTLARRATNEETQLIDAFLSRRDDANPEQGFNAVLWVLINSGEFALNH